MSITYRRRDRLSRVATTTALAGLTACATFLAGGTLPGDTVPASAFSARPIPEETKLVLEDPTDSPRTIDLSRVVLTANNYFDHAQDVLVKAPSGGFRPGHRLTVYFDVDADSIPDGHYNLRLRRFDAAHNRNLKREQEFRVGGGWTGSGVAVPCRNGFPMVGGTKPAPLSMDIGDRRTLWLSFNLWSCLQRKTVPGPYEWRAVVRLSRQGKTDVVPDALSWSAPITRGGEYGDDD